MSLRPCRCEWGSSPTAHRVLTFYIDEEERISCCEYMYRLLSDAGANDAEFDAFLADVNYQLPAVPAEW